MERFRRRTANSRVTTVVDRRFDNRLVTIDWKGKQNKLPKLASGSSSCSCSLEFEREDQLVLDQESCFRSVTGTPMKELLADEMSKGNESRRRSPSIIAKLMGFDGLPAQQNTSKQPKKSCENHQQSVGSAGIRKSSKLYEGRTKRTDASGKHLVKDVYEVAESPGKETRIRTSYRGFSPNPSEDEIAFVRKKFMDVKRFSTDEKFQNSKEFYDALSVLDSNKDLLLKFLEEPNSMFAKHLRDLQGVSDSQCGHVLSMKTASTLSCNIDAIGCQSGGEASRKIDISHSQKHRDGAYRDSPHRSNTESHKLNFLVEDKEDSMSAPTRIVVLKPQLGKLQHTARSFSSPSHSCGSVSDLDLHNESPRLMHSGSEMMGKRGMHKDFGIYEGKYGESREIAREITRQMKSKLGIDSFNVSSSGYKGYSADESSHDDSENDSSYDSEATIASSWTSQSRRGRNKVSTLHEESSVNKEAKRRLSERWKMTSRSQDVGTSGRGSTLAEMLAIPDVDIRPRNLDDKVAHDQCIRRSRRKEGSAELMAPLGISSRDGWKDGCIRNLPRSRSLPSSSSHLLSPKSSTRREALATERFLVRKESIDHGRSKTLKRDPKRKDGSVAEYVRPCNRKPEFSYPVSMEMIDDMQEGQLGRNVVPKSFDSKDSPEPKVALGIHNSNVATDPVADKEYIYSELIHCPEDMAPTPNRSSSVSLQESSTCETQSAEQEPSTNCEVGSSSSLQCAATRPESPPSSKESEQPSPVSVLEPAFAEDVSSGSECFERVSAELHGLRMQLQLLKLESEASEVYDEGSMLISSDEDREDSTESHHPKYFIADGDSWISSYLADLIAESGLDETDPDFFIATWHSPDCPIGHSVFENLEKKYHETSSCSKLERKQLFDCVNWHITENSQQLINTHPWVKSFTTNVVPQWWKNGLVTELLKMVKINERKPEENAGGTEHIIGDMGWMKLGDHIDVIGKDVEILLMDDLVAELMM